MLERSGSSGARRILIATAVATSLLLAACARDTSPGGAADADQPVRGGTVVIAGPNELGGLNSLVASEAYTQDLIVNALFLPLVALDEKADFVPMLAESWDWQGDTAVTFHLRRDVRWSDGRPTTAHDVAFTFDRLKLPETGFPGASGFTRWKSATVIDSFSVRFAVEPHLDPMLGWAFLAIMPQHALESVAPAGMQHAPFNQTPITNGLYRVTEHRANDRWIFEANPDYPASLGGPPYIQRVVWRIIPENPSQVTELLTGNVDLILLPLAEDLDRLQREPGIVPIVRSSAQYQFVGWNGLHPPLNDANVRRALTLAIDRAEILQVLRGGRGQIAVGPIGPFHWGYPVELGPLPFDTVESKRLLTAAGIVDRNGDGRLDMPDGRPLTIELEYPASNAFGRDVSQMIQADLAAIGVSIDPKPVEFQTMISHVSSPERNFQAVFMGWAADWGNNLRDPFHSASIGGDFQLASYSNPAIDSLLDAVANATDRAEATAALHSIQTIMRDEVPWTFLWYVPNLYAARDRLRGMVMDVRGAFVNIGQWWLADAADAR